jgi:DNA-binding FadR family transcriptional regulator
MPLDRIKRVRLQAEVEKSLRGFIDENGLTEGDKLPSERELVEQLGVGRSSLRESLRALEALGIVKVVAGKGIFAGGGARSAAAHELFGRLVGDKVTALEVLQVRRQLDSLAAELAARNANSEEIRNMEVYLTQIEELHEEKMDGGVADSEFHKSIYAASGNALLPGIGEIVLGMWIEHLDRLHDSVDLRGEFARTTPLHRPIFEAIRDHDPRAAKRAVDGMFDMTDEIVLASKRDMS